MVTVVQGKVCAKNHPDRLSRLATIHQRYRRTDGQTDGQTDFLWHRPGPNGRPKMDRDVKFAYIQFIRSANRKIRSSLTFIILVKIVITVVTTPCSFLFYNMCLYFGGFSQHVASLYTVMLLLELIPGATRPSTDLISDLTSNPQSSSCGVSGG